ncbi:MAG: hypothetical protein H7145_10520, partial [Akkermansiaceae bacterium]|nr:hypothetical protein [Armatimonadota bacterium]
AKWYPFSENFHPTTPVFLGIAPSYTEFIDTDWHPDTVLSGGYYGARPLQSGGTFAPSPGLTLFSGGRPYYSWRDYREYGVIHPSPYPFGYSNRPIYSVGFGLGNGQVFHGCVGNPSYYGRPKNGPAYANGGHASRPSDPRFNGSHGYRDNPGLRDRYGVRDGNSNTIGSHSFNGSGNSSQGSTARYEGKPNFIGSRDRAPGPVFDKPTGNPGSRPGFRDGARTDNDRRGGGRTPGGARSGGRYSKDGTRGGRGGG